MTELAPPTRPGHELSGLMTFLIADVRGYTRFTLAHGDEAAAHLATRFAELTKEVIGSRDGHLLELRGDEALVVFASARQALRAAVELQHRFAAESSEDLPLRVGIGLDAGEAVPVEGGFRGASLNLAARLCSLAGPGEVLASDTITNLARKLDGLVYADRGPVDLKGFDNPVHVMQISVRRPSDDGGLKLSESPPLQPAERPLPIGGFLGALPTGMLVARDAELERILTTVDAVQAGRGRLILLSGEPGVGKTRLAQEVSVAIRNRGFLIAAGRCYEPHQAVPFYPFLEAIQSARVSASEEIQRALPSRWPYLARLLPDLGLEPAPASNPREEQQRLFWAVADFLQAVAEQVPVAVLLDDLHWADSPTLELLQYLAEHTLQSRVLLLGIYRDAELEQQTPLKRTIVDLERERLVERISLSRFDPAGTATLMASVIGEANIDSELAELVYRRTDGNAFFTQEIVRSLIERGGVFRANEEGIRHLEELEIPETIRSVLGQRTSRLPEEAQDMLREASVLGQAFAFDDLQALSERDEDSLDQALRQAATAGLVREIDGERYTFNHAVTQQVLYRDLSVRRRRRLHQVAGETLLRLPERDQQRRASELARHFLEAGDDERALPQFVRLGDQAASAWSHRDAAAQYRIALQVAERLGDSGREAEIYERLGGLLTASIRYPEALAMLEKAAERYRSIGDMEREGRVVAQIGRVHLSKGSVEEGIARVLALLETSSATSSPQAVAALSSSLAKLLLARGLYDNALERARTSAELAGGIGEAGLLSESTITIGMALLPLGRLTEALEALEAGRQQASGAGDVFGVCRALQKISHIHLLRGDLALSRAEMEQARELAERMDNQRQIATTMYSLGMHAFIAGDWNAAAEACVRAGEVIETLSASWSPAFHLGGLALIALARGQAEEGGGHLIEYLEQSERTGDSTGSALARLALGDLAMDRLDLAANRLSWLLLRTPSEGYGSVSSAQPVEWARIESEDQPDRVWAAGEIESIRRESARFMLMSQLQALGNALQQSAELEEALALAHHLHYPFGRARIELEYGRLLLSTGDQAAAREHLDSAVRTFHELGAQPFADEASRLLTATD